MDRQLQHPPHPPLVPQQAAARLPLEIALAHSLVMTAAGAFDRLLDHSAR